MRAAKFRAATDQSMAASFNTVGTNVKRFAKHGYQIIWGLGTPGFTVRLATTAALAAVTPAGTGVGHTLTADANGALSIDSVAVVNADRVLIKNQVAGDDNGIYVVTDLGSAGTPFILTRATDFDQAVAAEIASRALITVTAGTVNANKQFELTNTAAITVDTTALVFAAGEPVGVWTLEASNSSTNGVDGTWDTVTLTISPQPAGSASKTLVDSSLAPWEWLRISYARTSGTGVANIYQSETAAG